MLVILTSLALPLSVSATSATGAKWQFPTDPRPASARGVDNIPSSLSARQAALKEQAMTAVLNGKATASGSNKVVQQGHGQFVELAQTGEDLIWTVLGDYGDADSPIGILQSGEPGPQHNEIPQPDRAVDNSTIWTEDFSQAYYEDLLFDRTAGDISMANYYLEQSSGAYSVDGDVTDWVQVPFNTAHYGRDWCGDIVCSTTWWFIEDSLNAWWDAQIDAGMTPAEIDDYLSQYDVWDRYDHDGDGNFDEADGYIDHFQSVHAGEGQETGGGAFGDDAIWSHRWYVQLTGIGDGGPTVGGVEVPFGGVSIGQSRYWVGDYTIEPENGGVGVFAHEFAHDLGLPDLYDTAGNTGGGENSTGFWTLMSSGSYGNDGTEDIGSKPVHMGAFEKVNLGWLDYVAVGHTASGRLKLGPSMHQTKGGAQALIVVLPDKEKNIDIGDPAAGDHFYYSSAGPNLDNLMYQEVALPAGSPELTAQVRYAIETDWDYAYVVVSTDGGATWTGAETDHSTDTSPNGQNFGNGITGSTGGAWEPLTADLSQWAGQTVLVGFRYWTDGFENPMGFLVDEISIAGGPTLGAEADDGFTFDPAEGGFHVSDGAEISFHFNAYIAEFRQYRGYDESLKTGPYNFGFLDDPNLQNYVEHFPYMEGLLITYWDETFEDNNTGANCDAGRCGGLALPVDAHPTPMRQADGGYWRSRVQSYDSPFGLSATKKITVHENSQPSHHTSQPGNPVFDDTQSYWDPVIPWASVQVPGVGVTIRAGNSHGSYMWVYLNQ
jgi:immune inhibitor A